MEATSIRFAEAARRLSAAARAGDLVAPTFRSPPRGAGLRRALRRRSDGSVAVSVALRSRPWSAVVADMIDGVIACNDLDQTAAGEWRDRLWAAVEASGSASPLEAAA